MSAFEYQLNRSIRRKSLSIVVRRGQVKVMAPVFVPKFAIEQFVQSKSRWVVEKLKQQQHWADEIARGQKQFVSGESFLYLGQELQLQVSTGRKGKVERQGKTLHVELSSRVKEENKQAQVKKLLKNFYSEALMALLDQRVAHYLSFMAVEPTQVAVKSYTRRWGSCSAKGVVTFNYLLMMAPPWVIDYVIVHELCHLVHMNHSARFWNLVEAYCPEHKAAKQYLGDHGPMMQL